MIFIVPRSQDLRFVNMYNYGNRPYNHDALLLQDEGRGRDETMVYFEKFDTNDSIKVQVITDYTNVTCKVYDLTDTLVQTVSMVDQNAGLSNVKVLQGNIDTTVLGNIYYAKLEAKGIGLQTFIYQSEYFQVDDFSSYPRYEFRESTYDGLYYGNPDLWFGYRIEADIYDLQLESESESFSSYNSNEVNLKTVTKRGILFKTDEIPRYMYEKLELGKAHKRIRINQIEYTGKESSAEPIKDTTFYLFESTFFEKDYEVYNYGEASQGGEEPEPDGAVFSFDGVNYFSNDSVNAIKPY